MIQLDNDGEVIQNLGDKLRFLEARAGDYLVGWDPMIDISAGDQEVMLDFCRAILDAFWSR
jgi:hypothetical protein